MPIEVELKLRALDERPLLELEVARSLGPALLGPATTFEEIDRYLDTADERLAAARWACRLRKRRERSIVSLKGPREPAAQDGAALHRRPEVEGPATDDADPAAWPPSEAREFLARLSGGAPVSEYLRLHQRRTERAVLRDGARLATLSLDRVRVERGDRTLGGLFAVELEHAGGEERLLDEVAAALSAWRGLAPDHGTKLEHALYLADAVDRPAP